MELIILGMGGSRLKCPFDCEIWAVNNAYKQVALSPKGGYINKIFLAHTQCWGKDGKPRFNWHEFNYLSSKGIEVWNTHKVQKLNSKVLDWRRLAEKFNCDYFSDTICYMLAMAIDGVTHTLNGEVTLHTPLHIRIYGADMIPIEEYAMEKGGVEYWIGYARGLGIKVENESGEGLLQTVDGVPYGEAPRIKHEPDPEAIEMKQPTMDRVIHD